MKKLITIFILSVTIFSCKRYEENPIISFRSVVDRINGRWEIESVTVNSIAASTDWDTLQVNYYNFSFATLQEMKQNKYDFEGNTAIYFTKPSFLTTMTNFSTDKKELTFWSYYSCYNYPICNKPTGNIPCTINDTFDKKSNGYYLQETWKIIKLTNKEMWLTSELNGNSYETHFKKKEI